MNPRWINAAYLILLWGWVASAAWRDWTQNPDYGYGLLVLPLAAYFAFHRIRQAPAVPPTIKWPAFLAMSLPLIFVLPLELINLSPLSWRLAAWATFAVAVIGTAGLALAVGGIPWLRAAIFPLLLAATAIPWPTTAEQMAGRALLPWLAETTGELLRFGGIPVERQGALLILPDCVVGIEQACSGLRSLQAAVMVSLAAGELFHLSPLRRFVIFAMAPIVAIVTNLARTLGLSVAGFHGGNQAIQAWHDSSGLAAMTACAVLLLGAAWFLRPRGDSVHRPAVLSDRFGRIPWAIPAWFLFGLASAHAWYAWNGSGMAIREPALALRNADAVVLPLPADLAALLHPDAGGYFRESVPGFGPLTGYHFFWKSSRDTSAQLYHRPDVCMPGAGWKLVAAPVPFTVHFGGQTRQWQILEYERDGTRATLLWGGWINHETAEFTHQLSETLQTQIMGQLIRSGTRQIAYEVAAVLLPFTGSPLPPSTAADVVERLFTLNENPARR